MAPTAHRSPWLAAAIGAPIGLLGGLIGLGGAEFRLPFLKATFRFETRSAIALNLAVSLVTLIASLTLRLRTTSLDTLAPLAPVVAALAAGAMIGSAIGVAYAHRISIARLESLICALLVVIGFALALEGFLPESGAGIPEALAVRIPAAVAFGLVIGTISSLLGVAGGELLIPMLLFAFGVAIKLAGTASSMISLGLVVVGCVQHARAGAFRERVALRLVVVPMALASIAGALAGAQLVPYVSPQIVKLLLGAVLIVSAVRIFRRPRASS